LQGDTVEFHMHKAHTPCRSSQYLWELSDQQAECTQRLTVTYEGSGDTVDLQGEKANSLATVDLCRGAYYTVIKFKWGNKAYRYT